MPVAWCYKIKYEMSLLDASVISYWYVIRRQDLTTSVVTVTVPDMAIVLGVLRYRHTEGGGNVRSVPLCRQRQTGGKGV